MTRFAPTIDQIASAATCASQWWADRLRDSAGLTKMPPLADAAGISSENILRAAAADYFTQRIREQSPTTAAQCDEFERLLFKEIIVRIYHDVGCRRDQVGWDDGGPELCLDVDYGPDHVLLDCARRAGVPQNMAESAGLPWKTTMRVSARHVVVTHGYGAPRIEIYGPIWGCSLAEIEAADKKRYEAATEYNEWERGLSIEEIKTVMGSSWILPEWQGPV